MHYIIVDLEATCWEGRTKNKNEIIEIGAVLINEEQEIVSEFQQFVKPLQHPILSEFCMELTSITQAEVDAALYFNEVLEQFKSWFQAEKEPYWLCSWGFYDRNQFINDCQLYGLDTEWVQPHISLKHQYRDIHQLRRPIGMKRALAREQIDLKGTHHRGIDDARNIAKIFLKYFAEWQYE